MVISRQVGDVYDVDSNKNNLVLKNLNQVDITCVIKPAKEMLTLLHDIAAVKVIDTQQTLSFNELEYL